MVEISVPVPGIHDPGLPEWGPYSKKYFGLSHLADRDGGWRFDVMVMPQLLRRKRELPDALAPCGLIPERAAGDLSAWQCSWRLDENVTAVIKFQLLPGENGADIECVWENNSDHPADAALHLLAQLVPEFPETVKVSGADALLIPQLPSGRGVEYDAALPREKKDTTAHDGRAFEFSAGETITFTIPAEHTGKHYFIRYRTAETPWQVEEIAADGFTAPADILVDVIAVTGGREPEFTLKTPDALPEVTVAEPQKLEFSYPGVKPGLDYSICAAENMLFYRRYAVDDLCGFFRYRDIVQQPYKLEIIRAGSQADQALDWVVQPLHIAPHSQLSRSFTVRRGSGERGFVPAATPVYPQFNAPYARSCQRLAAVTMTNVVYPVRLCGQRVRHFTPGRQWNSLYTWDSGFIGLGMLEISPQLAAEILNAYLTCAGDKDNAFVLHGTPLPVQIFLLQELWNRTGSVELLRKLYPGARQFYRYLAGHQPGSTTRKHCRKPLIVTWDYFYNSGGWDDYPPQEEVHQKKLESSVFPVVSTAILIRCARTLAALAACAGLPVDPEYVRDIAELTETLLQHSWDEQSGYFGYISCDGDGEPQGILRTESGENFNKGLDGTSPLISGGFPVTVTDRLWAHLESETECFTPYGISTVDRSASYFRENGYWNGAVWMPHQWFIWKAALDAGKGDFAWKIAETALQTYDRECEASGYCFEHFSTHSGWGGGWHHFSGLSTPVLCWHEAYFGSRRFSCGLDVLVLDRQEYADRIVITYRRHHQTAAAPAVVFSAPVKKVVCNGAEVPVKPRGNAVEITLPDAPQGVITYFI
ncbi:MAG: hypothetical protein E7041_06080 [Lentisphaerae bacterium]|nr:hypothetical protein [Lentisphaerota bacterium]